jgi:hypothetical protein
MVEDEEGEEEDEDKKKKKVLGTPIRMTQSSSWRLWL